jgi:uncharacterized protein YbjT (DUF2867 family)
MKVAIAGASGLTGSHTLQLLLEHPQVEQVIAIGRSPLQLMHPRLQQVLLQQQKLTTPVVADAFICCLGTTIKKAGSKEAFEAIDHHLPVHIATQLQQQGCRTAAVVSAMGANAHSMIFYNRVKGLMEADLQLAGFDSLHILRPSMIDGERKEHRAMEKWALKFARATRPLMIGPMKTYRSIHAATIAKGLVYCITHPEPGIHIYPSLQIEEIAAL